MSLTLYRPTHLTYMLDRLYDAAADEPQLIRLARLPLSVSATDTDYTITAVVPGLKPEDLNIQIEDNAITISGEWKAPAEAAGARLLDEIGYGKFTRTVAVATDLDSAQAEAHVENGLLTLRIPKAESAKPKVVKVQATR